MNVTSILCCVGCTRQQAHKTSVDTSNPAMHVRLFSMCRDVGPRATTRPTTQAERCEIPLLATIWRRLCARGLVEHVSLASTIRIRSATLTAFFVRDVSSPG